MGAEGEAAVHVWRVRLRSAARTGPLPAVGHLDAQRDGRAGQCAVAWKVAHVEPDSIAAQQPATPAAVCGLSAALCLHSISSTITNKFIQYVTMYDVSAHIVRV